MVARGRYVLAPPPFSSRLCVYDPPDRLDVLPLFTVETSVIVATMSPRVVPIPLSGGDRKAQAKARREAYGLARYWYQKSVEARAVGEEKIREADKLLCDAWTNVVFWGEPTRNSPTIAQAINGGRPLLWAKCRRCGREPKIDLRQVRRKAKTPVHTLEPALFCDPCSVGRKFRQRAILLGLMADDPDPNDSAASARTGARG